MNGPGGQAYGDAKLTEMLGGSGGAGDDHSGWGGGAGGGAIELMAAGDLTVGPHGALLASGGCADQVIGDKSGAGSGGAILLGGNRVILQSGSILDVRGGSYYSAHYWTCPLFFADITQVSNFGGNNSVVLSNLNEETPANCYLVSGANGGFSTIVSWELY